MLKFSMTHLLYLYPPSLTGGSESFSYGQKLPVKL